MLTKKNIKQFENDLFNIGDELTYRTSRNQKIESVLANKNSQKETGQPEPSLEDFLNQVAQSKAVDRKGDEPFSGESKADRDRDTLGGIFDEVLEEEGISIDDIDPVTNQSTDEENVDVEPTKEPANVAEESEEDITDQSDENDSVNQSIDEIEAVVDDIDDIENIEDDFEEDDSEFVLPAIFLKNEVFDEQEEQEEESEEELEEEELINLEDLFGDKSPLFDNEGDSDSGVEDDDSDQFYSIEESIEREPEKYRSVRDFVKEDELLFFNRIDTYNIYLTQAIVEILENDEYEDDVEEIVDLILDNAHAYIIHREVEEILKREIDFFKDNHIYDVTEITNHFNNLSEKIKENTNFFVTKIAPVAMMLMIVTFYAFFFVYRPVKATILYNQGYALLEEDEYEKSETLFVEATRHWIIKHYFFKYADLYEEKRYYTHAHKKYTQIIFGMNAEVNLLLQDLFQKEQLFTPISINEKSYIPADLINYDKETFLKIMEFEIYKYAYIDKSLLYFNIWTEEYDSDREILIQFANMNLTIYDRIGDKFYLDEARFLYDKLTVVTGNTDESLLLRARWAIRAEDDKYLNDIIEGILATKGAFEISEHLLIPYKEIVEYRLQKNIANYTADILDIMNEQYPDYIELPYLYALYYSLVPDYNAKKSMLLLGIQNFSNAKNLTKEQREKYIDMRIRLSELYLYDENNLPAARENITKAQILFEQDERRNLDINTDLYRLYFIASQIELLRGDVALASGYLQKSYDNGYDSVDMQYHMGLLSFLQQEWSVASRIFSNIITENKIDLLSNAEYQKVLYLAIGNSLIMQKNYVVAIMYYSKLLDLLNSGRGNSIKLLEIDLKRDTSIISLKEKTLEIENNIGVALYYLSKQKLGSVGKNEALLVLQSSNTVFQNLNREGKTLVRREITGVSGSNIRSIVSDDSKDLIIYSNLSYYLNNTNYWQANQRNNKTLTLN